MGFGFMAYSFAKVVCTFLLVGFNGSNQGCRVLVVWHWAVQIKGIRVGLFDTRIQASGFEAF